MDATESKNLRALKGQVRLDETDKQLRRLDNAVNAGTLDRKTFDDAFERLKEVTVASEELKPAIVKADEPKPDAPKPLDPFQANPPGSAHQPYTPSPPTQPYQPNPSALPNG